MTESQVAGRPFSLDELGRLRAVTRQIQEICRTQLRAYLDGLAPLFRPRRVLGKFIEGASSETALNADQNINELRDIFFKACGRPFDLRKELPVPLTSLSTRIEFHEWEYAHLVQTGEERKEINITSPLTWVLAYPTTYPYGMVRQVLAGRRERDSESVRGFVLQASLMYLMFQRLPELTTLLEGLRYRVAIRRTREMGELPLVTVAAAVDTVRPGDDLLAIAETYAGHPGVVEVVDPQQATHVHDPLQEQIGKVLNHNISSSIQ